MAGGPGEAGKKKGMQDSIADTDFGAVAAFNAADSPDSVKSMLGSGSKGTGMPGVTVKHDDR